MISERQSLYNILISANIYLPPYSDKSITVNKLLSIYRGEKVCPSQSLIRPVNLSIRTSKKVIFSQIMANFGRAAGMIWFSSGRLPSKSYLVDFLYAFDSLNPALGNYTSG